MAFSVIGAPGAGAPVAVHHGHVTFDYNQGAHVLFGILVGPGAGAPPCLCLALTMEWLNNWKNQHQAYNAWVAGGPGGVVHGHMVAVFGGFALGAWPATVDGRMLPLPFAAQPPGGLTAGQPWVPVAISFHVQNVLVNARYVILVVTGPLGSHAMGLMRSGNAVHFFDPNHGELHFATALGFAQWFTTGGYKVACMDGLIGLGPVTLRMLRYN
jgi:hypothetical protein